MRLGLIIGIGRGADAAIARVRGFGIPTCQVVPGATDAAAAQSLRAALESHGIEATSAVATGPPPEVYDFERGPSTIGLVPRQYRAQRIARFKAVSDFAQLARIPAVQGHCGFIPEDPANPLYGEAVAAIREVAAYCKAHGQSFRCETGQETPVTLVRAITDTGLDNVGVNFDCGNLILYGNANPVDAIDLLGPFIQGVHAKDGLYPTNPRQLGREVPIGEGKVNFPVLIARLKQIGYHQPLTIEREATEGAAQTADILAAKAFLENLIG